MEKLDREPAPSWLEISVGVICVLIGAFLLIIDTRMGYEMVLGKNDSFPLLVMGVLVVGLFFAVVGIRLVTGRQRKNGGLLSPTMLRVGGIFFAITPLLMLLNGDVLEALWRLISALLASIACFALAARRVKNQGANLEHDA